MKKSLHGYWTRNGDPSETIYVEKVFKKGHVTGFRYLKIGDSTVHSQLRLPFEELEKNYTRS